MKEKLGPEDRSPPGDVILVAANASPIITELKSEYGNVDAPSSNNRMGYIIKSIRKDDRDILVITGADTFTTLTAAYRFAELLGCYFNLAGDVIPDKRLMYPLDIKPLTGLHSLKIDRYGVILESPRF